jgi:hypothetical protein
MEGARCVFFMSESFIRRTGGMETHLRYLVTHHGSLMPVEVLVANDMPRTRTEFLDGAKITRVASFGTIASMPVCPSLAWKLRGRTDSTSHILVASLRKYHHCPLTSPFILTDFECQSQALSTISRSDERWAFQPRNSIAARLSATNIGGSPGRRAAAR